MALKLKKEIVSLEDVDEKARGLYVKSGDKYVLDIDLEGGSSGEDNLEGLKKKVAELLDEAKRAKKEKTDAEKAKAEAEEAARLEAAKKSGDKDALEKSWQDKVARLTKERDEAVAGLTGQIVEMTVGTTAERIATEIANRPVDVKGLLPHIRSRLSHEIVDGKPVIRVLDDSGKPTAMNIDEFKKSLAAVDYLQPLISGSKASGAGHTGANGGSAGRGLYRSAMSAKDKLEFIQKNGRDAFLKLPKEKT